MTKSQETDHRSLDVMAAAGPPSTPYVADLTKVWTCFFHVRARYFRPAWRDCLE
jgi:hypothetical protein